MQVPWRWVRGLVGLLVVLELLWTVPFPWSTVPDTVPRRPAWGGGPEEAVMSYNSTVLLQQVRRSMQYNRSSQQYETPVLAAWFSVDSLFFSQPVDGLAAWLDLLVSAKAPWSFYWMSLVLPHNWRIVPEHTQQQLALLSAGVPVLTPVASARLHFSRPERWLLRQLGWQPHHFLPYEYASCTAAVDASTLQPSHVVSCSLHDVRVDDGDMGAVRAFAIRHDNSNNQPPPSRSTPTPAAAAAVRADAAGDDDADSSLAAATAAGTSSATTSTSPLLSCPHLGHGLILGPLGRHIVAAAQRWRPAALLVGSVLRVWRCVLPTGGLVRPLCPVLSRIHLFAYDHPINALMVQALVLVVNARNWLFLITVAYKISRRLALLAPAPWSARLSGTALTLLGMVLGLWQSESYALLDTAFDVVLYKSICFALAQCSLAAVVAWEAYAGFVGDVRVGNRVWQLAKRVFRDARMAVLAPQALLVHNQVLADRLPRRQVPTVGPWPPPLVIPEEVDELPVSEVPRGFICPITQAIMRQPALLLHDSTIAPSTYDKEAITQWLAEQSRDPKNPGAVLNMKSVKLVYNGDLGRALEDWVASKQQQQQQQQQAQQQQAPLSQQQQQQQQQTGLAAWRRALSGQLEGAPGEGVAAAAAGVLLQMRGNMGGHNQHAAPAAGGAGGGGAAGGSPLRPRAAAAAAAAAARAGGNAGAAAAAAGGGAAGSENGSILSGAGALVRTSSAALAQVASLDLPAVAVAGLNQLAGSTRRMTTRALVRQQQQQQQHDSPGAGNTPRSRQRPSPRRPQPQQQQSQQQREGVLRGAAADSPDSSGSDTDSSGGVGSGSSSEVDSSRRRGQQQQQRGRGTTAANTRRRVFARRSQPAADDDDG